MVLYSTILQGNQPLEGFFPLAGAPWQRRHGRVVCLQVLENLQAQTSAAFLLWSCAWYLL